MIGRLFLRPLDLEMFSFFLSSHICDMRSDKGMISQEVGIDATVQDDWDMQRLGKTQQLKVSGKSSRTSDGPELTITREISVSIRSWASRRP